MKIETQYAKTYRIEQMEFKERTINQLMATSKKKKES